MMEVIARPLELDDCDDVKEFLRDVRDGKRSRVKVQHALDALYRIEAYIRSAESSKWGDW